jgi:hypothetical protein
MNKKIILLAASLTSFLSPAGSYTTVALPATAAQYTEDFVTPDWITSDCIVSAGLHIVPFGRPADIYWARNLRKVKLKKNIDPSACDAREPVCAMLQHNDGEDLQPLPN